MSDKLLHLEKPDFTGFYECKKQPKNSVLFTIPLQGGGQLPRVGVGGGQIHGWGSNARCCGPRQQKPRDFFPEGPTAPHTIAGKTLKYKGNTMLQGTCRHAAGELGDDRQVGMGCGSNAHSCNQGEKAARSAMQQRGFGARW